MPWVNIMTSFDFPQEKQEVIKREVAQALFDVIGKEERSIFVTFCQAFGFYRGGVSSPDSAIVELKYIGNFSLEQKQELTRRFCRVMEDNLKLDPQKIIMPVEELVSENWGRRAGNYS